MIRGSLVTLRPAHEGDRHSVYEWLAESEMTPCMAGPPQFHESPIPTWEQFRSDYAPLFFNGSRPEVGRSFIIEVNGEAIGHVSYDATAGTTELDIWLRSEAVCGRGYGSDALDALTRHLHETMAMTEFIIRPSRRNERAIKAFAKAGFLFLLQSAEQQAAEYGPGEHADTVVMCKKVAAESGA